MKSKIRNSKGITLIALVITIIVLLILAGVSISTLIGENGLIQKALNAKKQTEIANAKEKIELVLLEYKLNTEVEKKNTVSLKTMIEKIEGLTYKEPEECDSFPIIVIVDGYKFKIDEDLKVTYIGEAGNIEIPTIKIGKYQDTETISEINLDVEVETKDTEGISKIELIKIEETQSNNSIVQTEEIEGTNKKIEKTLKIYVNGKYKVKAYGKNRRYCRIRNNRNNKFN